MQDLLERGYGFLNQAGFNDQVSDNNVGSAKLQSTVIGNASTLSHVQTSEGTIFRTTTAATANGDGTAYHTDPDKLAVSLGTILVARFRYPTELASSNFRFGLDDSVTATRPTVGVTFESDAGVLKCHADSTNGDLEQAVTGHPDLTSGTTMVVGEWYDFEIRVGHKANPNGGPDDVIYLLNGIVVAQFRPKIALTETVEFKWVHWQDSGAADAVALDSAYHGLWIPRIAGT